MEVSYAATALPAAWLWTRHATFRLATVYLPEIPSAALLAGLGFREEPRGANTWLVIPNDEASSMEPARSKRFAASIRSRRTWTLRTIPRGRERLPLNCGAGCCWGARVASKPATGDGYGSEDLALVRQVCLYLATKLGDLLEDIAVVGGLAPSLLVDQTCSLPRHGTSRRNQRPGSGACPADPVHGEIPGTEGPVAGGRICTGR